MTEFTDRVQRRDEPEIVIDEAGKDFIDWTVATAVARLLVGLDEIEEEIDKQMASRVIKSSHDYSSSEYSGFDDGYNSGVEAATEAFRVRAEAYLNTELTKLRGERRT